MMMHALYHNFGNNIDEKTHMVNIFGLRAYINNCINDYCLYLA